MTTDDDTTPDTMPLMAAGYDGPAVEATPHDPDVTVLLALRDRYVEALAGWADAAHRHDTTGVLVAGDGDGNIITRDTTVRDVAAAAEREARAVVMSLRDAIEAAADAVDRPPAVWLDMTWRPA